MDPSEMPHKPDRVAELIGVSLFLVIWGTAFVVTRICVRIFGRGKLWWDDLALGLSAVSIRSVVCLDIANSFRHPESALRLP
jgi:hypothetical protein